MIAREIAAALDRESEMAMAEKIGGACAALCNRVVQSRCIEAGEGAQPVRRIEIDDDHVDDAVCARLHLETAVDLQR